MIKKKGAGSTGSKFAKTSKVTSDGRGPARKPGARRASAGGRVKSAIPAAASAGPERLQKVIAEAGLCSRRGAEKLIAEGRVMVNGQIVEQPGLKVDPGRDEVAVDGRPLPPPERTRYYMFNKPAGFLTTVSDPKGRPTIKAYLDQLPVRVFPVGRLDMDVEGLLILTNDGELAKALMHPSTKAPKTYWVKVEGHPDEGDLDKLRSGVLMVGDRPAAPAGAELVKTAVDQAGRPRGWLRLTLTEGRHHQVKRMCSAVGHPVVRLKRIAYGGLDLGALKREQIRPLTAAEVRQLKAACGAGYSPGGQK